MRTYKLANGYTVESTDLGPDGTEFVTRNENGEAISSVTLFGSTAAELVTDLRVAERLASL
jgi:hypothetical protein